eukprot:4642778-Prymnesium_polylepis.1
MGFHSSAPFIAPVSRVYRTDRVARVGTATLVSGAAGGGGHAGQPGTARTHQGAAYTGYSQRSPPPALPNILINTRMFQMY